MDRKFQLGMIITIVLISTVIGLLIGLALSPTEDQDKSNDGANVENDNVILNNDAIESADTVWDPLHHDLIDLDGRVEGRIISIELAIEDEEDQYHFLLLPDPDFKWMVNEENERNFRGAIMVEIMKGDDFILPRIFIGQHIAVQGPHVTDIRDGHGWNEIDPALVITQI